MEIAELNYSSELPVCEHRAEIVAALKANPVVIVCGDTGSGKTTQLPKMALEIGRAAKGRRIACTQPRRLAAVTMSERVAAELKTEVGGLVGFRHRFGRRISSDTRVEFMTDGVLLAETRFDPLLRAYDTIIVDEAHERSLNIDFLLGILKRLLERRRDLKVIVSSATLDAARFSDFFNHAPVISVLGRLFPIELVYCPPPEDEKRDLPREIAAAVAALPPRDDILVFLPGEREIREAADRLASDRSFDDIIPLLASLPASEQRRAFQTSPRRRIILATNVAETSVTIPGIRAVIDSGLARVSRYLHRSKVQRLQIEPVAQSSAKQRAGRCGRLGPGICVRLYSEDDLAARDAYTTPEILRSSLAGVILTMLDLRLGDIEKFPFIDPPKSTMVREGLRELLELGAIAHTSVSPLPQQKSASSAKSAGNNTPTQPPKQIILTPAGQKLAKIPVEPRLAKMLLAASRNAVLPSVLPLVAAMACDDPRRRPIDEREKANQAHARFRVPGSDFLGTLKLWRWWTDETQSLSQSKARKLCKSSYLSYPKMREWRDLTAQLDALAKRIGLDTVNDNGGEESIHRSLLAGLLSRIGCYDEEERNYRGAHGIRFALHPGSVLAKLNKKSSSPQWVMAGELVDTSRLFARDAAAIDVRWLEPVAGELCKHNYHSPDWDAQSGFVRAIERVTLYGLVIVPSRRCDYSRIDPVVSREIFIRHGLIEGEFPSPPPPVRTNLQLLDALRRRAERARRPDLFDAEKLFAHFDRVVPHDICSANALRKWLRVAPAETTAAFTLKKADWWPSESVADRDFPDSLRIAGITLALSYRHAPDNPESDGVTCTVRQSEAAALRLWRADWLVPGLLQEKVAWMLGTLPSALRRALAPLNESTIILLSMLKPDGRALADAVRDTVKARWGFNIPENAWDWSKLPPHLKMRFRVRDDATGRTLVVSRDLDEVLTRIGAAKPAAAATPAKAQTWIFGDIPETRTDRNSGWETTSYPALQDEGDGVSLKLSADPDLAAEVHASGVTRLFILALSKSLRPIHPTIGTTGRLPSNGEATNRSLKRDTLPATGEATNRSLHTLTPSYLSTINYPSSALSTDILHGAIREALIRNRPPVRTAEEFNRRLNENHAAIIKAQSEIAAIVSAAATEATRLSALLDDPRLPPETVASVTTQLAWLIYRGFPRIVPLDTLRHYQRYLKGAAIRLDRARLSSSSDLKKESLFAPYWQRYRDALAARKPNHPTSRLTAFRWMLEEYRISLFAQELHTPMPISPKRLDAAMSKL